jgi:mRNA interferase MazF
LAANPAKESFIIERGDIYLLEIGDQDGQWRKKQPILVIQNDIGNRFGNSIIVVPLLPNPRLKNLLLGVLLTTGGSNGLPADHVALFSQIMTVDKSYFRKDNFMGRPDDKALERVDEAIRLSLGLSTIQHLETKQKLLRKWGLFHREKNKVC